MKAKSVLFILLSISTLSTPVIYAKAPATTTPVSLLRNAGIFDAFHVHRQQNAAALFWSATGSINSFTIQHSYDGIYFTTIDNVTPEASGWNRYHDEAALPGFNYYRIVANMADGTTEYSDVEVLRIVSRK